MKKSLKPRQITLLGLMSALVVILSLTPLGYLRIGMLSATLNMIPVGIAAIALGPVGGCITGAVFGLTSFVSALTGGSPMGTILLGINPVLTLIQCFVPRFAMGLLLGYAQSPMVRLLKQDKTYFVTGFLSAFLNTVFYMTSLVVLFGQSAYVQELIGGRNILLFVCTFVGVNAVFEMICATLIVGILGKTMARAHLLGR